MKNIIRTAGALLTTLAMCGIVAVSPASAATGSWSNSRLHYTIYASGQYATTYHYVPTASVPTGATITGVSITVRPYINGRTSEEVQFCYVAYLATEGTYCTAYTPLTVTQTFPVAAWNGFNAKGSQVSVRHRIFGGTYPTSTTTIHDDVTENYTY